jgi:hypothetical protein
MLPTPSLLDPDIATWLRDADGNARTAVICWGVVLSAFVILRIPREVLLGCLIVAGATVGLAATVVDVTPGRAAASPSAREIVSARAQSAAPPRVPAAGQTARERPY